MRGDYWFAVVLAMSSTLIFSPCTHTHTHTYTHTVNQQLVDSWNVDAPSYDFTKLDPENEEHRKMVNEFLVWKGDFEGRGPEPTDGKIFK